MFDKATTSRYNEEVNLIMRRDAKCQMLWSICSVESGG